MILRKSQVHFISHGLTHLVLIFGSIVMLIPMVWVISTSLKGMEQIGKWPPELIPDPVMWSNYVNAFKVIPVFRYLGNSLVIVSAQIVGAVLTCSLVAYGFARYKFPGRDVLFILLLSTMMMPYVVRLVPLYMIYNKIGWINTFLPLVVPPLLARSPFFVFLLTQFFKGIPQEIVDAARIDGCNDLGIWWRIMMPLSKTALATVTILAFQTGWDEFLAPLVYMAGKPELRPLSVGLYMLRGGTGQLPDTHYIMVLTTLMILPTLILFIIGQRYFIQGVILSGLKG